MQEVDILIEGGTVLTLDDADTILHSGSVAIRGDRIVAVGPRAEIASRYRGRRVVDAAGHVVMPGLVNAHTHAAMTCFRGIADDLELMEWLNKYIFPAEAKNVDPELAYWGSLLACAEMIRSGTTCFCDMYIFEDETARAASLAGMRCLLGEVLFDFPSPNFKTPDEGLACTESLITQWAGHDLVRITVEPHALYTCSPDLLKKSKALADRHGVPLSLHLLETRSEREGLTEKLGCSPVRFLRDTGLLDENLLAFHCVWLDEADIEMMARAGAKAVHNPESNMKLASGIAPVPALQAAGVTVALGTDGCASNNNLDMLQEMDTAAKLHKVSRLDPTAMSAKTVLRMATVDGARALGMGADAGRLAPGMKADVITLDFNRPHLTPVYSEYSHLVYCASGSDVDNVVINGRLVMENRRILTFDEGEAMDRVNAIARRIRASLGM
ncbi:MAG: amidohydrolase [Syntrophales bacterium]|nr:amidohydrolase [Syntrophales bacterium]